MVRWSMKSISDDEAALAMHDNDCFQSASMTSPNFGAPRSRQAYLRRPRCSWNGSTRHQAFEATMLGPIGVLVGNL